MQQCESKAHDESEAQCITTRLLYIEVQGTIVNGLIYLRFTISEIDIHIKLSDSKTIEVYMFLYNECMASTLLDHRCVF